MVLLGEKILADCAFLSAKYTAQSVCMLPFYETKQPEELAKLKKS